MRCRGGFHGLVNGDVRRRQFHRRLLELRPVAAAVPFRACVLHEVGLDWSAITQARGAEPGASPGDEHVQAD